MIIKSLINNQAVNEKSNKVEAIARAIEKENEAIEIIQKKWGENNTDYLRSRSWLVKL